MGRWLPWKHNKTQWYHGHLYSGCDDEIVIKSDSGGDDDDDDDGGDK